MIKKLLARTAFFAASFLLLFLSVLPGHAKAWVASGTPISTSVFVTADNYGQMATDSLGNVYITGVSGAGVTKYDPSGNVLASFGPNGAYGVAITPDDDVIVTDSLNGSLTTQGVYKFDSDGNNIDISTTDMGDSIFIFPFGAAVDSNGFVYITDFQGNGDADMVRKFDSAGNLVATIFATPTGNGAYFDQLQSVAVDSSDNLYVLDSNNARVQKFNSSGVFQLEFVANGTPWSYPEGFTVDQNGNVYVNDSGNGVIQVFDTNGVFQQELDATDLGVGTFDYLAGSTITDSGILYLGNYSNTLKVTFDHADPVTTITPLSGNTTSDATPTITGSTTDSQTAITAVEYSIDSGSYTACVADDGLFDELTETYSCNVSPDLSVGSHTIDVRATDSKNNVDVGATIASYSFSVTAGPTPTPSGAPTASSTPSPSSTTSTTETNTHCAALPPDSAPYIFKITRSGTDVTIYYSPISSNVTKYQLMYGYTPTDERFAVTFDAVISTGAEKYVVSDLVATQKYSFWMRGINDCAPGAWSNIYTTMGLWVGSTETKSPTPSPSSSTTKDSTNPNEVLVTTDDTSGQPIDFEITIVDTLGLPIPGTSVTVAPDSQSEVPTEPIKTNEKGVIHVNTVPGNYTITTKYNDVSYSEGITLSKDRTTLSVKVPIPLRDALIRQLYAPIDATYVVKAGIAVAAVDTLFASIAALFAASGLIVAALFPIYQATSRSILKLPFDYLASLMQFTALGITTKLAPYIPSLRRKRKSNGLVFDAYSFKPIPKVYVILYSSSGNLQTNFTDLQGRYNFQNVAPDDYQIKTEAPGYKFPSTIITSAQTPDVPHVYQPGEVIPLDPEAKALQEVSVPMDPKQFGILRRINYGIKRLGKKLTAPSYIVSIAAVGTAVITNPSQFNQIVSILFGMYLLLKMNSEKQFRRTSGRILTPSKLPVVGATVKLYRSNAGLRGDLYTMTKTDTNGRYYIQPEIGNYQLEILTNEGQVIAQTVRIMKNVPTVDRVIVVE